jgi:outer membrane lipoprotein-sorting protein
MIQQYAQANSYQDEGVVETATHEETSGRIEKMPFKTYFKRPKLFRFEWIDYFPWKDGRKKVVWSNENDTFTYWEPDTYEKEEELSLAIAGATGISRGAAHKVPTLLLNDDPLLASLKQLKLLGEETFEGELCYRISGKSSASDEYELWIAKKDFLLRKLKNRTDFEDFYTITEEIHRNIKLNQPIAQDVFNFKPPIPLSVADKETRADKSLTTSESPTWTEFHSVEGRFKVLLPDKPVTQTLTLEIPQGRIVHYGFTATKTFVTCVIDYADLPKTMIDPGRAKLVFDEARDELLKATQGKLVGETIISVEGHAGREVTMSFPGGAANARFFMVNERLYQLLIMRLTVLDESTEDVMKFFSSFKLVADTKPVAKLHRKY